MAKRSTRLQFSEEELSNPVIRKAAEKAKMPQKLSIDAKGISADTIRATVHRNIRDNNDDNSGTDAANTLTETAEGGYHTVETAHRSREEKPYREADRAEAAADKANIKALEKEHAETVGYSSNPHSKWQQKRAIKKEYAAAKAGSGAEKTVKASETTAKAAKKSAEESKKVGEFIAKHKKAFLIVGIIVALILVISTIVSSCSLLLQSMSSTINTATYPLEDSDMLAAEAAYCGMEAELQEYLDNYESTHDYDEYHFDLDDIEHDPYVLISAITALQGGEWTIDEIGGTLALLFEKQYILTEIVTTETRYKTVTATDVNWVYDPESGSYFAVPYMYDTVVAYDYSICTVTLENFNLSHVPVYILSQDQLSMYAMYMATLGNRPDLFPGSGYVGRYYGTEYETYEIPPEALEDEQFAKMIAEAEKYLGYPYVWGGSSPATSFDCSGFVSWVCNNCGVGWNFGRLGAEALRGICTAVSAANVKPGDLVFFQGTFERTGVSHVGIYVGGHRMIHAGDPIQYADLSSRYWQAHFLSYGRLPPP